VTQDDSLFRRHFSNRRAVRVFAFGLASISFAIGSWGRGGAWLPSTGPHLRPAVCDATVSDATVHQDGFGDDLWHRPQRSKMLHCSPFAGVALRVKQDRTRRYDGLNPVGACAPYYPVDCHQKRQFFG
jgi:hypothetical protein